MFKKWNFIFVLSLIACKSLKIVDVPEIVQLRLINHHNDSCSELCSRFVFSHVPCDSLLIRDKFGKLLPLSEPKNVYDSACITCDAFNKGDAFITLVTFEEKQFSITIDAAGGVIISNNGCTKPKQYLLEKYKDSAQSVAFWNKLNASTGRLVFYTAIEAYSPPYFLSYTLDSFVYNLSDFCSSKEQEEERQFMQTIYTKYVKAQISPNPFEEQFEFTLSAGKISGMLQSETFVLTFFDDMGHNLKSKIIKLDTPHAFSFPLVPSGKTIYYKVAWGDYSIGGQIAKR